jgi:AraC family transcriptional regulator of adaptative response/methylated-DNA-[protein]-cysteine methyltransferase
MIRKPAFRRKMRLPDEFGIPNEEIRYATGESLLGPVLVASSPKGVLAILIGENPGQLVAKLQKRFPRGHLVRAGEDAGGLATRVIDYIDAPKGRLELELDLRGTDFQQRVWQAMREIPAGRTSSYSDIAHAAGMPRASRAVGTACANSNLAFAVPCHRVLHKGGSPRTGHHWGLHSQQALIDREA